MSRISGEVFGRDALDSLLGAPGSRSAASAGAASSVSAVKSSRAWSSIELVVAQPVHPAGEAITGNASSRNSRWRAVRRVTALGHSSGVLLGLREAASSARCSNHAAAAIPRRSCSRISSSRRAYVVEHAVEVRPLELRLAWRAEPLHDPRSPGMSPPRVPLRPRCMRRWSARRTSPSARMSSESALSTSSVSKAGSCWLPSHRE